MRAWLEPRAFWIAFALMAIVQLDRTLRSGASVGELLTAFLICVIGGIFWGAIGTYVYRRFYKAK